MLKEEFIMKLSSVPKMPLKVIEDGLATETGLTI